VEQTHSWLNRSRRQLVRWEKKAAKYLAFIHLAFGQLIFAKLMLAEAVAERGQQPERHHSPDALAQIEATLTRLGNRAEHARLVQQREELKRPAERPQPTSLPLGSLMDGWRTGDPRTRRGLLAAFFDELDVMDGRIVSAVPRSEYAAEVAALLESVRSLTRSSPGGIRGYSHNTLCVPQVRFP
jgi:hypothetical protein